MRISRTDLIRRWAWSSALAFVIFLILSVLEARLKAQSGLGIRDLGDFANARSLRLALEHWWRPLFALSAGFELGLGCLFLPLYGTAFYLSGIVTRETVAPRPSLLRHILDMLALVPIVGALCDAASRALYFWMLTNGTGDSIAALAAESGLVASIAFCVGLALFVAAFVSLLAQRKGASAAPNHPA